MTVEKIHPEAVAIAPATGVTAAANPAMVGLPTFIAGAVTLGLTLTGYVPGQTAGAVVPVVLMASGLGSLIATYWALRLGESVVAGIFGIFTGFWLSYAVLVLGVAHNWFGIAPSGITHTIATFLISWLVVVGVLTLATLSLPWAYTLLFAFIELSLAFSLAGTLADSTVLSKLGGYAVLVFTAVGAYLFWSACLQATGRKALPLGRPVLPS
jgi:uncharacterized protein